MSTIPSHEHWATFLSRRVPTYTPTNALETRQGPKAANDQHLELAGSAEEVG